MAIGAICSRVVAVLQSSDNILTAARLMRDHHVGSLVVTRMQGGMNIPVGMITDRDIAVGVVALGLDPAGTAVGDVVAPEIVCVQEDAGVAEVAALMRQKGIRRLPVVNAANELVGLVTADDLLQLLGEEMSALAGMVSSEQGREKRVRSAS